MGGTQSWLNCDATYPTPVPGVRNGKNHLADGNLLVAVLVFLLTIVSLLAFTCIVNCIFIARRRRQRRKSTDASGATGAAAASAAGGTADGLVAAEAGGSSHHYQVHVGNDEDEDDEDDGSSLSSGSSSIDSVTARAMRLAQSRRISRAVVSGGASGFDNRAFEAA